MKRVEPLSQDNLGNRGNDRVVHDFKERSFRTPVTPGSITEAHIPSAGVLHVHLSTIIISFLRQVDRYEPSVPRMCSPDPTTLQPRTNILCAG
jgi:hypothetical protein